MSKAFAQRTVKFINKVGTFTAYLQCSQGELWQTYQKDGDTFTNIVPNFATIQPVIDFVVISSRVSGITGLNGVPTWYFGTTQINNGSTVIWKTDYFELVPIGSGRTYYGLKIKKNLVDLTGGASITIKAVGDLLISATATTDTISAQAVVSITPASSNGVKVVVRDITQAVVQGTRAAFTFESEEQQMVLKADTYKGSIIVTSGLTYQWQRVTNGSWQNLVNNSSSGGNVISGVTTSQLTIGENQVMTYTQLRCEVKEGSEVIGYGVANVMDATDPYIITPNPTPLDETIEDTADTVYYTPQIVSRDSGTTATDLTAQGFKFTYTTGAGVDVTPSNLKGKTVSTSQAYPVNYTMCSNNGDISVIIESVADLKDY